MGTSKPSLKVSNITWTSNPQLGQNLTVNVTVVNQGNIKLPSGTKPKIKLSVLDSNNNIAWSGTGTLPDGVAVASMEIPSAEVSTASLTETFSIDCTMFIIWMDSKKVKAEIVPSTDVPSDYISSDSSLTKDFSANETPSNESTIGMLDINSVYNSVPYSQVLCKLEMYGWYFYDVTAGKNWLKQQSASGVFSQRYFQQTSDSSHNFYMYGTNPDLEWQNYLISHNINAAQLPEATFINFMAPIWIVHTKESTWKDQVKELFTGLGFAVITVAGPAVLGKVLEWALGSALDSALIRPYLETVAEAEAEMEEIAILNPGIDSAEVGDIVDDFAEDNISSSSSSKPYSNPKSRPSYANDQVDTVWENAKDVDGKVYDPNTGEELFWDKSKSRAGQWDMGHIPEAKYSRLYNRYMNGEIDYNEFMREYRDPSNYRPESISANRSHLYE